MKRFIKLSAFAVFLGIQSALLPGCGPSIHVPSGGFHGNRGPVSMEVEPTLSDGQLDISVTLSNTSDILALDIAHASYTLLSPSLVEIPPRTRPSCTLPVLLAGEKGSCSFSYEVSRGRPLPVTWEASIDGNIFQFRFE